MGLLDSIARGFGLQSKRRARVASGGGVLPDLALWDQNSRIGGGITPARISSILRLADGGDMRSLMDLANECRQRDAHLQAVLATSEETISGLAWQLVATQENERAKDRRAREWCEKVLRACPSLPRLIGQLAGAVYYSYAVSEILWAKVEGKMIPTEFKSIAQRRFGFKLSDGSFVYRENYESADAGLDFRAAHPFRFVVSQPRVNGDVANREGLCRPLIWMSVFRNWVIADWLKTAEISWKPWRIGTYKKTTSADGSAVLPDSSTIKIEWPGGSGGTRSTHGEFVNVLGQEMSKATLGQTETTQSSSTSGYAQAKVHDAVRRDLREARARQVAADITRDLIAAMILINFGSDYAIPRFEFVTQDPIDLKAFGEGLALLVGIGVEVPQKWARDQAGIPEPKKGEPILALPKPPAPAPPPGNPNDPEDPDGEKEPAPSPEKEPTEDEKPAAEPEKEYRQAA
jgi:phage gp29-like protein